MKRVFVAVLCFLAFVLAQDNSDQIFDLPGVNFSINFNQYAGYITVDEDSGRNLFYWFVESQRDPASDKVVLWLNGGPGCSSIGGMMTENGPFRPVPGGNLIPDPYSWNTVANVIYLESPAGVGFSYSENYSDYTVGDERTANDAYIFLVQFFQMYPQFLSNPFWVTGESYGGHYVPELVMRILQGNEDSSNPYINIEGFMAGNPWTFMPYDNVGAVFDWWSHSLISDETYYGIVNSCNFTDIGPLYQQKRGYQLNQDDCDGYLNTATDEMGNINIYDIYVDVCLSKQGRVVEAMARSGSRFHAKMIKENIIPPYLPCEDDYTAEYMNLDSVKAAIHAESDIEWTDCSNIVNYNYSDVEKSVIPLYQYFMSKTDLSILVYSGDVDAIVPTTGTKLWIATLNNPISNPWTPWNDIDGQVGGYVVEYDRMTFATVRNAGHMVPQTQPSRGLTMFNSFLYSSTLPTKFARNQKSV